MSDLDIEAIRRQVRAMDFMRGTPAQVAMWHEDMADSRANLVSVPPPLVLQMLLRLLDHPNADRSLSITPMIAAGAEGR